MNYERIYNELVVHAQQQPTPSIKEVHHILPRSMGGSDEPSNLVSFTPRQHFIAHRLLAKFTTGRDKYKMLSAVVLMTSRGSINKSSRVYAKLREERIRYMRTYRAESTGATEQYFPFAVLGKDIKTMYTTTRYHHSITKQIKYNKYSSVINLCYVLAKLGYKGYSSASTNYYLSMNNVLLELGFVTKEVEGSKVNYSFTEDYLLEVTNSSKLVSVNRINKVITKNPTRARGTGELVASVYNWNKNNPLKLIQYVSGKSFVRKINGWEGDIPERLLVGS